MHGGRWWAMVAGGPAVMGDVGGAIGTCLHGVVLGYVTAWVRG